MSLKSDDIAARPSFPLELIGLIFGAQSNPPPTSTAFNPSNQKSYQLSFTLRNPVACTIYSIPCDTTLATPTEQLSVCPYSVVYLKNYYWKYKLYILT